MANSLELAKAELKKARAYLEERGCNLWESEEEVYRAILNEAAMHLKRAGVGFFDVKI